MHPNAVVAFVTYAAHPNVGDRDRGRQVPQQQPGLARISTLILQYNTRPTTIAIIDTRAECSKPPRTSASSSSFSMNNEAWEDKNR